MTVHMDIWLAQDGSDLRGVYRVWIPERRLFRAFRFIVHDFEFSPHLVLTHNHDQFLSLDVSKNPEAYRQNEQLPPSKRALLELMSILLGKAQEGLPKPDLRAILEKTGSRAIVSKRLEKDYESAETFEAVYGELFALPESEDFSEISPPTLH